MDGTVRSERKIYITIIDLAGNAAYDLLNSRKPISLLEDSFGVTQLTGAAEYLVETKEEMMELIERATSFRRTAPTLKNDASSRSHSICRIRIDNPSTSPDGLLYLVDLAGSEVARDVEVHGADRMRETKEINLSLSVLKECIRGKAALKSSGIGGPKRSHVPFRQSALTKVLKPVFDPAAGQSYKTVAIACLNPSLADVGASKNTLRYAELLRVLLPESKKVEENSMVPMTWGNAKLKEWIAKNVGPCAPNSLQFLSTNNISNIVRHSSNLSNNRSPNRIGRSVPPPPSCRDRTPMPDDPRCQC
jgi:kinesin family protein 2/24